MWRIEYIVNSKNLLKWFLGVFIILGALTFSCSTLSKESYRQAGTQTEIKISVNKKEKRTVFYKSFLTASFTHSVGDDQFDASLYVYAGIVSSVFDVFRNTSHHKPDKEFRIYYSPRSSIEPAFKNERG